MTGVEPKPSESVEDVDTADKPLPDPDGERAREGGDDTEGLEGLGNLT